LSAADPYRPLHLLGLAGLLALALALRLPLLDWAAGSYRQTEAFSIEEVENVRISTGMLHEGSANPHAFEYPSLFYALSLLVEAPVRAFTGPDWTAYLVAVRGLSLAFGLAVVGLGAELARQLGGPRAALLAAALLATDRTMIDLSTRAKPNMAQIAFLLAGFLVLFALTTRPRLRTACLAAACFALAAASKWLGGLGLVGIAVAPALARGAALAPAGERGLRGLARALGRGLTAPLSPLALLLPLVVFGLVVVLAMPYALLSPLEFGYGLGQVFFAQAGNRRALPAWVSLDYVRLSLGWVGAFLAAGGLAWGLARLARGGTDPRRRRLALVVGWTVAYGLLVLFVFARLPSYVDLAVPFLAVLAGAAWAGDDGLLRRPALARAAVVVALAGGLLAHGGYARARAHAIATDTRTSAARWLAEHARVSDPLVADLGVFVPDSLTRVRWNWWGNPPRLIYDETRTWGDDPVWPDDWYSGHRQVWFVNARWAPPESLLAAGPRFVATHADWVAQRRSPGRSTFGAAAYDSLLADPASGYALAARFARGPAADGPEIRIYERRRETP
jgi:4-amino-4-deoxy-L-arabinose transferase-like glycosyltransferase